MTLKQLIYTMIVATIICWIAWAIVVIQIDPTDDGLIGIIMFYISLFLSLIGTFFLISFGFRKTFVKFSLDYKIVATSFRQSFSFALLVTLVLFLQSKELLTWWNIILIIVAISLVEGFSLSVKKPL